MPAVTSQTPNLLSAAIDGLTATFQGKREHEKDVEEARKFDESLTEQKREHDDEIDFKLKNLETLVSEGLLDRVHATKIENLRNRWESQRQVTGIEAETVARHETFGFQGGENRLNRELEADINKRRLAQSETESRRQAYVDTRGQDKRFETDMQGLSLSQQNMYEEKRFELADTVLGSVPWSSLSEPEKKARSLQLARLGAGTGRWDAADPAARLSDEQKIIAIRDAWSTLATHEVRKKKYTEDKLKELERSTAIESAYDVKSGAAGSKGRTQTGLGEDFTPGSPHLSGFTRPLDAEADAGSADSFIGMEPMDYDKITEMGYPNISDALIDLDLLIEAVYEDALTGVKTGQPRSPADIRRETSARKQELIDAATDSLAGTNEDTARWIVGVYANKIDAIYERVYNGPQTYLPDVTQDTALQQAVNNLGAE